MAAGQRSRARGFTLVELLTVVAIIGVLGAVAIPRFTQRQGKAFEARLKHDVRAAAAAEEAYFGVAGEYFGGDCSDLPGMQVSPGVTCTATVVDPNNYEVQASHPSSPNACTFGTGATPNLSCS